MTVRFSQNYKTRAVIDRPCNVDVPSSSEEGDAMRLVRANQGVTCACLTRPSGTLFRRERDEA